MALPNTAYVSGGVQFGGIFVNVFRLADPDDNSSGVLLGRYLVETITPSDSGILGKRPGADGGRNGWWICDGDVEGSAVIQRTVATTPSLKNGDYFDAAVRVDSNGDPVAERFVIHSPGHEVGTSYRKQNVSVIVDQSATGVNAGDQESPT